MPDKIDIITIWGRTDEGNGVSRPFYCEGDDGSSYFVKLKNVGFDHLVKEWVAGRLGELMGLRVAKPTLVSISPLLVEGDQELERELGHGVAFGSQAIPFTERLGMEYVRHDPDGSLSKLLLFDWWIKNSDRALTEISGNPNLIWQIDANAVVAIDFDNAFDTSFNPHDFWTFHALRNHKSAFGLETRIEMHRWLTDGLGHLPAIWNELPDDWLADDYGDPRSTLTLSGITAILASQLDGSQAVWTLPPTAQ